MDKGPFSLYDFMGYFIPGALALYLILIGSGGDLTDFSKDFLLKDKTTFIDIPLYIIVFYIILSYCMGHFLSFFSTLTVERYTRIIYGDPSKNLLSDVERKRYEILFPSSITNNIKEKIRSNFGLFFILPLIMFDTILYYLKYKHRYMNQIPSPYRTLVMTKINDAFGQIGFQGDVFANTANNYHQLLIHYNYEYTQTHASKLMNYVALYGFLRVITLISSVYLTYLVFYFCLNYSVDYSWNGVLQAIFILAKLFLYGLVTFIFFLGYLKFYRRYTLENLMLILLIKKP
ncbi:hypothetical protein [Chryseobacterium sp. Mn2064]|uniref:hypothetical protein n=1 Tax=Chryseobacterium sp. Mn2064 TaxID=3395263 RepID=UPI003BD2726F